MTFKAAVVTQAACFLQEAPALSAGRPACWSTLALGGEGRTPPLLGRTAVPTCSTCSRLPVLDETWYLLELLRSPLEQCQRTLGLGSPQTTARKMAFFPAAGRGRPAV